MEKYWYELFRDEEIKEERSKSILSKALLLAHHKHLLISGRTREDRRWWEPGIHYCI